MNRRSATVTLGVLIGVAALAGCSAEITGTPLSAPDTATSTQPRTTPRTTTPRTTIPRTTTPRTTTRTTPAFDATVGDCVNLSGTESAPEISRQTCGSTAANYKVVALAADHTSCPSDADGWYANTIGNAESQAFCLDVDWTVGDCYNLYGFWPERVECSSAGVQALRLASIGPGADGSICSGQSHVYYERRLVACLDSVSNSS